jgi:hypothetical protein
MKNPNIQLSNAEYAYNLGLFYGDKRKMAEELHRERLRYEAVQVKTPEIKACIYYYWALVQMANK